MTQQAVLDFTLGDRLRKARVSAGLDQLELAARIAVSRGTVSNYELNRGKKPPKVLVLRAWAHECGVPYDQMVDGFGDALDPQKRALADGRASSTTSPKIRRGTPNTSEASSRVTPGYSEAMAA